MPKKGNGRDPATARMVELLERIADRLDGVENEVRNVTQRLDRVEHAVREMDARLTGRIDNLIALTGASHRDHEERIAKLEAGYARLAERAR